MPTTVNITELKRDTTGVQANQAKPGYFVTGPREKSQFRDRLVLLLAKTITFLDTGEQVTITNDLNLLIIPVHTLTITFKL